MQSNIKGSLTLRRMRRRAIRAGIIISVIVVASLLIGATFAESTTTYAATSDEKWGREQTIREVRDKIVELEREREQLATLSIIEKVSYYADKHNVDPKLAHYVVEHESQYDRLAVGDLYVFEDGKPIYARGLMQITRHYHPDIPDSCAFNADCALDWGMKKLSEGKCSWWTTCRAYMKKYND